MSYKKWSTWSIEETTGQTVEIKGIEIVGEHLYYIDGEFVRAKKPHRKS